MKVWAETGESGKAIRIFKTEAQAARSGLSYVFVERWLAVEQIRRAVFSRDDWKCSHCAKPVTWYDGELHERQWRGRGGEVSVANSTTLCQNCHTNSNIAGHGRRKPQWSKKV